MPLTRTEVSQLLEQDEAGKSTAKQRQEFYTFFYPGATFLLDLRYDNLFEMTGRGEFTFRCKGCGETVRRWERKDHHSSHKREYNRIRES